jgi:hypothetical protein
MKRVALNQEVVSDTSTTDLADRLEIMEKADFRDAVIGSGKPLVRTVVMSKEVQVLVRPSQLEPSLVPRHRTSLRWSGLDEG